MSYLIPYVSVPVDELIAIARNAGASIMDIYASNFDFRSKSDASPVTEADERAELIISNALRNLTPDVPVVAEEAVAAGKQIEVSDLFWLVDPLDGTKEFISRNGEFTVNIALIHRGDPIAGVVFAPALDRVFCGLLNVGAFVEEDGIRRSISVRSVPPEGLTVVASRSHGDADELADFLRKQKIAEIRSTGSSLKICLVAAGEADLYPRLGRTMEWDIAAGDAVVRAAGGNLKTLSGQDMKYGKPDFENPHFVVFGKMGHNWLAE